MIERLNIKRNNQNENISYKQNYKGEKSDFFSFFQVKNIEQKKKTCKEEKDLKDRHRESTI